MQKLYLNVLLGLCCIALPARADVVVIADFGGESVVRFYESLQPEYDESVQLPPNAIREVTERDMLPVVSHRLTPGQVAPQAFDLTGMSAIFLVGADNLSAHWLEQNRTKLIALNATGLVVNVKTEQELQTLREIIPELSLLPVPGDDLAERMSLSHYPALITETGVSQ